MASMFKLVFLKIPNVLKGTVFAEKVTYCVRSVFVRKLYDITMIESGTVGVKKGTWCSVVLCNVIVILCSTICSTPLVKHSMHYSFV